jgi:hypothetical protein
MVQLKIETNEIYALLIVFLISLGVWQFPIKQTLPDFNAAMAIQRLAAWPSPETLDVAAAAAVERAYASALGQDAATPSSIASFLLVFPSILLALAAVFIYLALRQLDFRRSASAFVALLFALSLSSMQFLPGVFSNQQLSALFFSIFLLSFCSFVPKRRAILLLPAAIFAAGAGYVNPAFGFGVALVSLSFAYPPYQKREGKLWQFGAIAAVAAVASFVSPGTSSLYFAIQSMQSFFLLAPFLLAAASCAAVLFFYRLAPSQHLLLFISAILVSAASPLAGAMLLVIPAAEGITQAASDKLSSKQAKLACAFFVAFFAIYGVAAPVSGELKAAVMALLVSLLSPLLLHFYEYKNGPAFVAWGLALLALSASVALFYQLPPQKEFYPQYADRDITGALSSLSGKGVQKVALLGNEGAARFYLPSSAVESPARLSQYLASGRNLSDSGTYLVISLSYLDGQAAGLDSGFEAYFFYSNFTQSGRNFAQFVSTSSGNILVRELDAKGDFALRDGQLIDSSGGVYANVPLSRMLLLRQDLPFSSAQNRLIAVDEGESVPYFVKLYSGNADELAKVSETGKVSVFRVK